MTRTPNPTENIKTATERDIKSFISNYWTNFSCSVNTHEISCLEPDLLADSAQRWFPAAYWDRITSLSLAHDVRIVRIDDITIQDDGSFDIAPALITAEVDLIEILHYIGRVPPTEERRSQMSMQIHGTRSGYKVFWIKSA